MNKRLIFLTSLILILFVNKGTPVSAQTIDEEIQEKNEQIEKTTKNNNAAKNYLSDLTDQISQLESEYQQILNEKASAEKDLNKLRTNITDLKEKIDRRNKLIVEQARDTQIKQGNDSVLTMMINSKSMTDVVNATIGMTKLINANNETMQAQIKDKKNLEVLENEINQKLVVTEQKTKTLEEKENNLVEAKLNQKIKVNEISAELATETAEKKKFEDQKVEAEKKRADELKALEEEKKREAEATALLQAEESKKAAKAEENQKVEKATAPENSNNEKNETDKPTNKNIDAEKIKAEELKALEEEKKKRT